ncbi:hypothetical protein WN944_004352 [Citrus x changshan-huyou]|uniref:Uncharacterized protein n=1 Tax=Citrus x changshan-huyou TaxID=2935761 RepID=A0AAP0M3S8_9ROSI
MEKKLRECKENKLYKQSLNRAVEPGLVVTGRIQSSMDGPRKHVFEIIRMYLEGKMTRLGPTRLTVKTVTDSAKQTMYRTGPLRP